MTAHDSIIARSFQGWKMWLAIILGLGISVLLIRSALSKTQFIEVEQGTGTHSWVDFDQNNQVDLSDATEFKVDKNGNYKELHVTDALAEINWTANSTLFIFVAILLMVGRDFFYILRIRLLSKNQLSWRASTNVILIWEFASALSPGVVGGAAVAMFILNKEKIPLGKSTAIVFITAMMDNLFYLILIPFLFLFVSSADLFPSENALTSSAVYVFWIGFFLILGVTSFLFLSIFVYPKLATRFLSFLFRIPFLNRWRAKAIQTGHDLETTSAEMHREPFVYWIKIFAATFGSWISRYLVINAILQAFIGFGFVNHILILGKQFVLWLFMLVSPTPGGSGVAEFAFSELLAPFSQSAILLISLAVIWRLISYFPYLVIGSILLPRWLKK